MTLVLPCKEMAPEHIKKTFLMAYTNNAHQKVDNAMAFNESGSEALRSLAKLREKNWPTTRRTHRDADLTGLAGELAVYRMMGLPLEEAWQLFSEGLNGDQGFDLVVGQERVDIKSTASTKQLRFKFSRTNRHRDQASAYVFCHVTYTRSSLSVKVLGWAFKHHLAPYRHIHDEKFLKLEFSQTLIRKGIAHPISALKTLQERGV